MFRWLIALLALHFAVSTAAVAQQTEEVVWVQIEARPNLNEALQRAEDFAGQLEDVNGFALGGGWYAISLGPYRLSDAEQVLRVYRAEGLIPRDSYIARARAYGTQFFPRASETLRRSEPAARVETAPATGIDLIVVEEEAAPELSATLAWLTEAARQDRETLEEARWSEQLLPRDERETLQRALKTEGFYGATIDGAFGRGTRNAMAAWQDANNLQATGILTIAQRALLLGQYNEVLQGLGLAIYSDRATGIEVKLPASLVAFDRYEPPFAHFRTTGTPEARVLLISQPGDRATLQGLYEVMQTLEIVPLEGPRKLGRDGFTLVGRSQKIVSETRVRLENGVLKGFTLVWPAGDEKRRSRLVDEMERSFFWLEGVLDPSAGDGATEALDFVSGLAVRKPRVSRSGFYVDQRGSVVTTAEAVQSCTRILLDDTVEVQLSAVDPDRGLAILTPQSAIAPPQVAQFSPVPPRLQSDVAVAGYSYEGILGAPSVTFGTLADLKGLSGEEEKNRLQLASLPGDAGGPVVDGNGNVVGMLLPRAESNRRLPDDVSFALAGPAIAEAMRAAGLSLTAGEANGALPPEDITTRGVEMTVLVSCWE
ncbi:MAG: serine protease [Pseudomonadota bacterium]